MGTHVLERGEAGTGSLSPSAPEQALAVQPATRAARPSARGKFLFRGEEKLYIRGTTYGTFRPGANGSLFPPPPVVARDFAAMASAGFNAVRTYTPPPRWLLDLAFENGLSVLVGIAWEQHVDFLEERWRARKIERQVAAGVEACSGHPAVLCYAVGNEIPSEIVRWLGRRPVERYIRRLYDAARREDPEGLVTYVNYPPTEYLQLPFLDLMCVNVYLERRRDLDAYLARLHNIAGERPLLMAEVGLDSRSHGEDVQAETLDWQIRTAFASGCAGAFVFAWTDEWYVSYLSEVAPGGAEIRDWDFGLTGRDRRPKPALQVVTRAFDETPFEPARTWPSASVVVCTFNGSKTIRRCLEAVRMLDYPDVETIVVNDGSRDSTSQIAAEYRVRLINTENRGLATARNVGMRAARGEIVAYLDDDAQPDPHWLRYLVSTLKRRASYAGVGGPNLPPAHSSAMARCVASAPGGPVHVLVSDREAEHIPGCNMAFRKQALEAIGGFDPQFAVAGDDVDICWRLLDAGHEIGFSPSAVVWHEPRDSIRAYWRQQRGYGRAEALLERKWPNRYRPGGRARWMGRLYGKALLPGLGRWRVYYGTWGSELFQSMYSPAQGRLSSVPLSPAWFLAIAGLSLISLTGMIWRPLLLALPLLIAAAGMSIAVAGIGGRASCSRRLRRRDRAARWAMTTLLHLIHPVARSSGRSSGTKAHRLGRRSFAAPIPCVLKVWTDTWQAGEERLAMIESRLRRGGAIVARGGVYDRWDLDVRNGWASAARLRTAVEEHGGGYQLLRARVTPRFALGALTCVAGLAALALGAWIAGGAPAALVLAVAALALGAQLVRSAGHVMGSVLACVREAENDSVSRPADARKLGLEGA